MPSIKTQRHHAYIYSDALEVDWSNPITAGLRGLVLPGRDARHDVTGNHPTTKYGTSGPQGTPGGLAGLINDTNYIELGDDSDLYGSKLSVFACQYQITPPTATKNTAFVNAKDTSYNDANGWHFQIDNTNIFFSAGSSIYTRPAPTSIGLHTYGASYNAGAARIFADGGFLGAGTVGSTIPEPTNPLRIGNSVWKGDIDNLILVVGIWNRTLTDAEQISLGKNPWQLFKSRRRVLYFDVGGGAPVTHATTGALETSGAQVAGTALNFTPHAASGVLETAGAQVVGAATNYTVHATTGVLETAGAEIVGAASNFTIHSTSGVLETAGAQVEGYAQNGVGAVTHATSGVLETAGAEVAGTASNFTVHATSGALETTGATVAGTAALTKTHATSGILETAGAQITGAAALPGGVVPSTPSTGGGGSSWKDDWRLRKKFNRVLDEALEDVIRPIARADLATETIVPAPQAFPSGKMFLSALRDFAKPVPDDDEEDLLMVL